MGGLTGISTDRSTDGASVDGRVAGSAGGGRRVQLETPSTRKRRTEVEGRSFARGQVQTLSQRVMAVQDPRGDGGRIVDEARVLNAYQKRQIHRLIDEAERQTRSEVLGFGFGFGFGSGSG